ncbi:ABC transporter permease [Streptococcus suis]|nr:ABC transporter permease [Streptococcus suis]
MNQLFNYWGQNYMYILEQFIVHIYISLFSVILSCLLGLPLAIYMSDSKYKNVILNVLNAVQTIPSMALLTIFLILFGLGSNTVILLVTVYSMLPIIFNTISGLDQVGKSYLDVAKGIGMNYWQMLFEVRLPIAFPIILIGIKNSLVIAVGTTTIGSFLGAGGLGDIILRGINTVGGFVIILTGILLCALTILLIELFIEGLRKLFLKKLGF